MAILFSNNEAGFLYGKGLINSILSGLPRSLRPSTYISATNLIMNHFTFVKEAARDAPYWPDWQMSIGVLGYADFGWLGLIVYPFISGLFFRWIYNTVIISKSLGEAGWLLYIPIVFSLWNPLLYGPDSIQTLRLLIFLAMGLYWATKPINPKPGERN